MHSALLFWFFCVGVSSAEAALTKKQAFEFLKSNGPKWNLTQSLSLDAQAKSQEARSSLNLQAQLAFRQYAARINPIQFGGTNSTSIDTLGFGTSALEMSWTFMDPEAEAKILATDAQMMLSESQTKFYQNELTALVMIQYLTVQRLKQQIEMLDTNIERSALILKLATAKKNVGAGIALDMARAKNLFQLDQLKKMAAFIKLNKAQHELALSLGEERLEQELPALKLRKMKMKESEASLKQAIESRGDLKAADSAVQAAGLARTETGKSFFPTLKLLGEVGTTQATLLGLPPKNINGFVGVLFSVPLISGGLLDAKRKEAAILQMKADWQLKQARNEVSDQMKESLTQMIAAEEALQVASTYLKTSQEEADYAEKRYQAGGSNILDLTNSHVNLATAADTRLEYIFNYEAAKIAYFRALGDFTEYFSEEK